MLGVLAAQNLRISDAQNHLIGRHVARSSWSDLPDLQGAQAGGSTASRESRRAKRSGPIKQAVAKFAGAINQALARFAGRDGIALSGKESRARKGGHLKAAMTGAATDGGTTMTTKVVRIFDTNNSMDLGNTLDGQIDVVWGLIAALETLCRESGYDAYAKGALAIANRHVDALSAIRQNLAE